MNSPKTSINLDVLGDGVLRRIAEKGQIRRYPADSIIINEGDPGHSLFIILEGRVKTYAVNEAGKEIVFDVQGPGEYVGELAFDGGERSASVMTLEPVACSIVHGNELGAFLIAHPEFANHLIMKLIRITRRADAKIKSLALMDVYGRVVQFILGEAVLKDGRKMVEQHYTQQDIADRVGSSREMVNIILKDLTTGGYLALEDKRFVILRNPPAAW